MRCGIIEKDSVCVFMMLAEALAMVAYHYDHGIFVTPQLLQVRQKICECRIRIRDFAIVKMIFIGLRVGRRRLIGIMWVVEVKPDEMRAGRIRVHPFFCALEDVHASPLEPSQASFSQW